MLFIVCVEFIYKCVFVKMVFLFIFFDLKENLLDEKLIIIFLVFFNYIYL